MESCTANRLLTGMKGLKGLSVKDVTAEQAWTALMTADKEKEVEDIREVRSSHSRHITNLLTNSQAIISYAITAPDLTFQDLETAFRADGMNTYFIAKQQEVSDTHTIINLQGKIDQTFAVSIQFTARPRRAKFAEGWPESPEENMTRLAEAGFVMDRLVEKCRNCNQLGHKKKDCPEEPDEKPKLVITCANCSEEGE